MSSLMEIIIDAARLIGSGEVDTLRAILTSLYVSLFATCLASLIGIPLGLTIGARSFRGKSGVYLVLNTLLSMPTVVVGLFLYLLFSRQGPLGPIDLLFTPSLMIIGETILILPMVIAFTATAVNNLPPGVRETAASLGAGRWHFAWTLLDEARFGVLAAVIAGFGRAISEVGAALMLGGNIRGHTRTMTTTIALETSKGEFGLGLALALILLTIAFAVNLLFYSFQQRARIT